VVEFCEWVWYYYSLEISTLNLRVLIQNGTMEELTERQKILLSLIVHEHTLTAKPVGSAALVRQFGLPISSATIRNEMTALTEMGYLRQPHTSAGRVPT